MEIGNSRSLSDGSQRRKHCVDSVDGISDLPDSILGHILSFLPTKNAVSTHILSQRWKFLWTKTTNLDFHYTGSDREGNRQFATFVNYVLRLHNPGYLNRFSLTWETWCNTSHVNSWLSIAVARNVHELFIHVTISRQQLQVLRSMFSCEGLRSLELDIQICISPEIVVSLPRLESLKLISIYFQSKEDFRKLLDGCPVLKNLYIDMDIGEMMKYFHLDIIDDSVVFEYMVSSTSLRRLEIYARAYDDWEELESTLLCSVHLDAPSLEYVKLDDEISSIFIQQKSLTSLVEADIQLSYLASVSEEENYCNPIVEAICSFDSAKSLTLSTQVTRAISCATIKMRTTFNKLTRLEVKLDSDHWSSLQDFIELSDNLEVLAIEKDYDSSALQHYNDSNWREPIQIPGCFSKSLRKFSMVFYDGYPDELDMIAYILKHGRVLEVLHLRFGAEIDDDEKKLFEEVQKIIKFPRKSPVCVVEFDD